MTKETSSQEKPRPNWIRIIARIWSAPIILVVTFYVLGTIWSSLTNGATDPNAVGEATTLELLPLIFIAISTLGLALAWRWEKIGGIFSLTFSAAIFLALLLLGVQSGDYSRLLIPSLLGVIVLIPGILFLTIGICANRNQTQ
jgi:hypothetical protein